MDINQIIERTTAAEREAITKTIRRGNFQITIEGEGKFQFLGEPGQNEVHFSLNYLFYAGTSRYYLEKELVDADGCMTAESIRKLLPVYVLGTAYLSAKKDWQYENDKTPFCARYHRLDTERLVYQDLGMIHDEERAIAFLKQNYTASSEFYQLMGEYGRVNDLTLTDLILAPVKYREELHQKTEMGNRIWR